MRVLVVSEGVHELGDESIRGALEILTERLLSRKCEFACERINAPKVHVHFKAGKGHGLFKRALAWLRFAKNAGFDAVVIVIDRDDEPDRIHAIDDAQRNETIRFPRAFGVAVRAFDAWMLADETALSRALQQTISRQPDPERIADPKAVCASLIASSGVAMSQRLLYSRVAEAVDLATIEDRCATGFKPFAERVQAL